MRSEARHHLERESSKRIVPVGQVLLLVGSSLLLVSFFLPWFTVTYGVSGSNNEALPAGSYDGLDAIGVLGIFGGYVFTYAAFVWLILVAVFGVTSVLVVRKFSWFGISGILVLVMSAIQMFFVAISVGLWYTFGTPSIGFAYGFVLAVIGSAVIETGARLKTPAPKAASMRTPHSLGILLIGLGIASTVGGVFALVSPTKAAASPGILLMVLGFVFAVGGLFALIYQGYSVLDMATVAMHFGVLMFVVGMVLRAKPSMVSRPALPSLSP